MRNICWLTVRYRDYAKVCSAFCQISLYTDPCYNITQAVYACTYDSCSVNVTDAAGEMLSVAGPFLEQQMHPTVIIGAFRQALDDLLTILKDQVSIAVDITNRDEMTRIIKSCIGTKFITKWSVQNLFDIFVHV